MKETFDAERLKLTEEQSTEMRQLEKRLQEMKLSLEGVSQEAEPQSAAVSLSEEEVEKEKQKAVESVSFVINIDVMMKCNMH